MPSKYLNKNERVVRYVPWGKLRRNENDTEIYGPLGTAFKLREGETYLSVTWCEYFEGSDLETLRCAALAIRNSKITVKSKAMFAHVNVGDLERFITSHNRKIRIIHEAEDDNPAHIAIRGWIDDSADLLERISEEVWTDLWSKQDVDSAPQSPCDISERGLL